MYWIWLVDEWLKHMTMDKKSQVRAPPVKCFFTIEDKHLCFFILAHHSKLQFCKLSFAMYHLFTCLSSLWL